MPRTRRPGYTIFELLVVLAVLILLGAAIVPSLTGFGGNSKQQAAADIVRSRIAEARAKAIERGAAFRVAVNADKTRIRVAPDGGAFDGATPAEAAAYDSTATEDKFDGVTLEVVLDADDERDPSSGGWITVATVLPDGTCREERSATVTIKEKDFRPILVQVRALTGQARTTPAPKNGGQP